VWEAGQKDPKYRKVLEALEQEAALERPAPNDGSAVEEVTALPREEQRAATKARREILQLREGMVYRKGLLWVPNDKDLIQRILESEHDTKVAGHMGQDQTIELIRCNFWGPKMDVRIIDFVRSCLECQQNKAARHHPYGLLHPLELPYAPWQSIAMDFITDLPISDGCDQLWVVIDRFTKMAHFLPLLKEGKTASDLSRIFAREIWWHHGLPSDIVSDRDSRFTSEVWKEFLRLSGIRSQMSMAFHPQTDGQTERLNQTIEAYLRSFTNHEQNDWVSLLPLAEFACNNSVTPGTGLSPFYANYGFNPNATNPAAVNVLNPASKVYAHWMHTVHDEARKGLKTARERMRRYADPNRKEAPAYQVGDLVMLNGRNIQTRRPSRKMDHKNHGPFQIEELISPLPACLTLPRKWKIHNVFHVSCSNPIEPASTERPRTHPEYYGKQTTSSRARSTMSTRFLAAPSEDAVSYTSSDGSTIPTDGIGPQSHSTTSQ